MRRAREDGGWALITAVIVAGLTLSIGLALIAFVDGQQAESVVQRKGDASFNLAEAVLNGEGFIVSRSWPGAGSPAPSCTSAASVARCPDPAWVRAGAGRNDFGSTGTWNAQVFDNRVPNASYYQEGVTNASTEAHGDANGDGQVWIRAQGVEGGRKRTLIALYRQQRTSEGGNVPHIPITAGHLRVTDSGKKVLIDTLGKSAAPAPVRVRCLTGLLDPNCLFYQPTKGQITPELVEVGYSDGGQAIATDVLDRLRARAQADGTYYPTGTCPSNPSGALVFIENADCSWGNISPCCNTETSPGLLIAARGTVTLTGRTFFYGLIYAANSQRSSGDVVTIGGSMTVQGSIVVDGNGGMAAGGDKANLVWDDRFIYQDNFLYSYGSAGLVQNTWREISGT